MRRDSQRRCVHAIVSWRVGLRSAFRTRVPALIQARNPDVAAALVNELEGFPSTPTLGEAASSARELAGILGFEPPSWRSLAAGERPPDREPEELEPGTVKQGWQHEASSRLERRHRDEELFPRMGDASRALIRSQAGPGAGLALSTSPLCFLTRFNSQAFRVILLRRLQLPLPLTARNCRCGHHLDVWPSPRECDGAGLQGRVTTNVAVRDLESQTGQTRDGLRWQSTVCLFLEVPNLQLTPQSCTSWRRVRQTRCFR